MCGISGIYCFGAGKGRDRLSKDIEEMLKALEHRGPEKKSQEAADFWALGITRLAIIDLANENNVFSAAGVNVFSVVNGEIFNYRELKDDLRAKGYEFRSHCDSEVVGFLYEEYGLDFINSLNAQYALILVDTRSGRVYLFRDR